MICMLALHVSVKSMPMLALHVLLIQQTRQACTAVPWLTGASGP